MKDYGTKPDLPRIVKNRAHTIGDERWGMRGASMYDHSPKFKF
jgi:hypothetical protein